MKIFLFLLFLILIALSATAAKVALQPLWTAKQYLGEPEIEQAILQATNDIREKNGLSKVTWDDKLSVAERQHTKEMVEENYFEHSSPHEEWKSPSQRAYLSGHLNSHVGENILFIKNPIQRTATEFAKEFLRLWMNSPGHRENILTKDWTLLGVGVYKKDKEIFAGQLFGEDWADVKNATLQDINGELLTYRLEGKALDEDMKLWFDNVYYGIATVEGKKFTGDIKVLAKSGIHKIAVSKGTILIWQAVINTDAEETKSVSDIDELGTKSVEDISVSRNPYNGFELTAEIKVKNIAKETSLAKNHVIIDTVNANDNGLVMVKLLLLPDEKVTSIGLAFDTKLIELFYIDTSKPLKKAFRSLDK
ncbi:MAG: CAP domain-containing protein [bacterium]